jgi:protein phosphatase slingshot
LNVTKEVDNFFPTHFNYLKIWVNDEATTELLVHWQKTYDFIKKAKFVFRNIDQKSEMAFLL